METKLIEGFNIEINLHNDKWLINCSYSPHKNMIRNHLRVPSEKLDTDIFKLWQFYYFGRFQY